MEDKYQSVYEKLQRIYQKQRRNHPENGDSKQMCCMWSTNDPPDIIEGTPPFDDIEEEFSISISDDVALELYDMHLDEAARKIMEMRNEQCQYFAHPIRAKNRPEPGEQIVRAHSPAALPSKLGSLPSNRSTRRSLN